MKQKVKHFVLITLLVVMLITSVFVIIGVALTNDVSLLMKIPCCALGTAPALMAIAFALTEWCD